MTSAAGLVWITGELVVVGYAPDGDTIAFTVDVLDLLFPE